MPSCCELRQRIVDEYDILVALRGDLIEMCDACQLNFVEQAASLIENSPTTVAHFLYAWAEYERQRKAVQPSA